MSIQHYDEARRLIEHSGGDFEGPKPESLVIKAESALDLSFPTSYRRFLLEMGAGDINGLEICGVINDNFEKSSVPNGVWLTLNERKAIGLNPAFILIREAGDGSYYALDTRLKDGSGEAAVVHLSADGKHSQKVADNFGSYLLDAVKAVV